MIAHHDETATDTGAPSPFAMVGIDSALLLNPKVWDASGHLSGFSDPMVDCRETRSRYRADQLVVFALVSETQDGERETVTDVLFASPGEPGKTPDDELFEPHRKRLRRIRKSRSGSEAMSIEVIAGALEDESVRARTIAPGASEPGTLTAPRAFNLMFRTYIGALEDSSSAAYLRPETAQGIFLNFKNVLDTARVKLPFGIGQIGKALPQRDQSAQLHVPQP